MGPSPAARRGAQCHFPRMPGDFGGHMLHLCDHLFRSKQSGTAGGETGAFFQLQQGCRLRCRKHSAQVSREGDLGEGGHPPLWWRFCPLPPLPHPLAGTGLPSPGYPWGFTPPCTGD